MKTINWNKFVPNEYTILDTAKGDLNQDGFTDAILILKNIAEPEEYKSGIEKDGTTMRPLLILHGQKDGTFKLVAKSNKIVIGFGWGGKAPATKIVVKNNYFSIEHIGIRWERIITFKYDLKKKEYILHKDAGEILQGGTTEKNKQETYNEEQWDKIKFKEYISNP